MAINVGGSGQSSFLLTDETPVVVVHGGSRGPTGLTGDAGPAGAAGASIVVKGPWVNGATYAPLDAVTSRSSANSGLISLWVQVSDAPASASLLAPHLDPSRWTEIGATDVSNITGAIWTVYQIAHEFTWVGQPAAYSYQVNRWVLADNRRGDETAIAVVKEIISEDLVILQTSGEIRDLDSRVIWPDGSAWEQGRLYYVHSVRGRVTLTPPSGDPSARVHPVLIPTSHHLGATTQTGVALPWKPDERFGVVYRPAGIAKFYYLMTAGQTLITGADLAGNVLAYDIGNVDVFWNGSNLSALSDFTAADSINITLATPAVAGDAIEVWTLADPAIPSAVSTAVKIDTIEPLFDGVQTTFPLTYDGGVEALFQDTVNCMIWIDGTAQEPATDFDIVFDAGTGVGSIVFPVPPVNGTRFWGLVGLPVGTITNGATINNRLDALEDPTTAPNSPLYVIPSIANTTAIPGDPGVDAFSIDVPERWRGIPLLFSLAFQLSNIAPSTTSRFRVRAMGAEITAQSWDISVTGSTLAGAGVGTLVLSGVVIAAAGVGATPLIMNIQTPDADWVHRRSAVYTSHLSIMPAIAA